MSGLYLIALIAIWLFAGRMIYRVWRYWKPADLTRKILHIMIGAVLFSFWFGGAFWEVAGKKMYWDAQVREMCAKDGGIKVYETVTLPAEMFNKWGQVDFYHPTQGENALGQEYVFKEDTQYYRQDNPQMSRVHYQVLRRADGKLLGETILYDRIGGDLPGPWHHSSFACPDINKAGSIALFSKIFIASEGVGK